MNDFYTDNILTLTWPSSPWLMYVRCECAGSRCCIMAGMDKADRDAKIFTNVLNCQFFIELAWASCEQHSQSPRARAGCNDDIGMWGRDTAARHSWESNTKDSSYFTQTGSRHFYKQKQISLESIILEWDTKSQVWTRDEHIKSKVKCRVTITVQITGTLVLIIPRNVECCGEIIVSGPLLPALASPSLEIKWFVPVIFTLIDCFSWCWGSGSLLQSDL